MFARLLMVLAALLICTPALADDHDATLEGHWAFRIDDATIFVFTLEEDENGHWTGAWTRPGAIESNGAVFRRMSGEQTVRPSGAAVRDGVVQLTFAGPEGSSRNDVLRFRLLEENRAQLDYAGIPGNPYPLVRVPADSPLGPFDDARIYDRDNAVTEADYVPLPSALEEVQSADPEMDEGAAGRSRITPGFLDDL